LWVGVTKAPNGFLARLVRESGAPHILEGLTERLPPSDLQSLMLEVYSRVATKSTPKKLLDQYERDRFVRPSVVDARVLGELDRIAWMMLPAEYSVMELSPVCPLGTSSVVATVNQNKIVATIRNTEVVSDATNVLALECAVRRRRDPHAPVLLATSQRMTRAQATPDPRSWAHFRLLCLCAAGRDRGSFAFEVENAVSQIGFYLRYVDRLSSEGWRLTRPSVALTDMLDGRLGPRIEQRVIAPLRDAFPMAEFVLDPTRQSGRGYYQSLCFKLHVTDATGSEIEIGDGGDVPWTQKLLGNAKERQFISAIGQERLAAVYG
jgi:hypothetical protein